VYFTLIYGGYLISICGKMVENEVFGFFENWGW